MRSLKRLNFNQIIKLKLYGYFSLTTNHTIGVFGISSYQPIIYRPQEQVAEIDDIRSIKNSDASLFHLKTPVNRTRQVQAIFKEKRLNELSLAWRNCWIVIQSERMRAITKFVSRPFGIIPNQTKKTFCIWFDEKRPKLNPT